MKKINLPNIWGQGEIFAYSGLEGKCEYDHSLVGTLMADAFGMQLRNLAHPQDRVYLIVRPENVFNIYYDCILSDTVCADVLDRDKNHNPVNIVFVNENTVVLRGKKFDARLVFEYDVETETQEGVTAYEGNGNRFAVAKRTEGDNTVIAISYYDNAAEKALSALDCDVDGLIASRVEFYKALPRPNFKDEAEERLYYKCFSILRSTVYTPHGKISHCALTPDRFPHRAIWLWDTAYLVTGFKHMSYDVAKQAVLAILELSHEDGFLPHMTTSTWQSNVTQPPVLSWAAWELYKFGGDKEFLAEAYGRLSAYVQWDIEHRDLNGNGLPEWKVDDDPLCRCGESGMDNTPRFDEVDEMDCVDFASFLANDMRCLSKIASVLGKTEDSAMWQERYDTIKKKINTVLWDEEDGFYYDKKISDGQFHKVKSVSSFITIFAGVCDEEKAKRMVEHLTDPKEFGTPFPIPTVSADDKTYPSRDMFCGTVWLNFNYLVALGLEEYGFYKEAEELKEKTVETLKYWYLNDGTLYEFYDSQNEFSPSRLSRKGKTLQPYAPEIRLQSVRDFSWGACAVIEFILGRK